MVCECDANYFGPDCSLKMCHRGDDPYSLNQDHRTINIAIHKTDADLTFSRDIHIRFYGSSVSFSLASTDLSSACTAAFLSSDKFSLIS